MSVERRATREPLVPPGGIDHHVSDMTVTASADLTLGQLQENLGAHGQWLPIDGDPGLSLGRLVETNSSGPLRLGFGAWRDFLLGVQFTTPSGKLITAGGRAIKNVAGYDLTKFMIGQQGIFGRLITITSRAYKRPDSALLVKFQINGTLLGELLPTASRPQWAMIADGALWCGYYGDASAIEFYETNIRAKNPIEVTRQSIDADITFRAKHWSTRDFRASVPPTRLLEFIQQAKLATISADAAFGIAVGPSTREERNRLREIAASLGGSVTFDDPSEIRAAFEASGPAAALLKRIETAFQA